MTKLQDAIEHMGSTRQKISWNPSSADRGGTGGKNVLTGGINRHGKKSHYTYPCHNPIHNFKNTDIIWSCFAYRTKEEVARAYHRWLSKTSPWAKTGVVPKNQSLRDTFDVGFVFEGLSDTPANLLHNFLIGSRMAAEWPNHIQGWYTLVTEYRIEPAFAFLMMTVWSPVGQDYINYKSFFEGTESLFCVFDKYDWPLDMSRATEDYVRNFCSGNPVGKSITMFAPSAQTAPVNTLWGGLVPASSPESYVSILKGRYASLGKERSNPSPISIYDSPTKPKTVLAFDLETIVKIIKTEQERLFSGTSTP